MNIKNCKRCGEARVHCRELCGKCYRKGRRDGSIEVKRHTQRHRTKHGTYSSPTEVFLGHGWDVKESGCHEYTGAKDFSGYGMVQFQGKSYRAHRLSFEHFVGPLVPGLVINHLCNNPPCVRPDHLEQVTHKQNAEYSVSQARRAPSHKQLTGDQVRAIRASTMTDKELSEIHGCHHSTVSRVRNFKTHVNVKDTK